MDGLLNKHLVATFADEAEALAARSALEAGGIPCDVDVLSQVPRQIFALGSLGRSIGIWVLAADLERATAVIADLRASPPVDESALEAEALAGGAPPARAEATPAERERSRKGFPGGGRALAFALLVASLVAVLCGTLP